MDSHISLPYYASTDKLPAPLPTREEIAASTDVLKNTIGRRVVRVGSHFVVKYGMLVRSTEGEAMLFVRQNTSIPVPTVYAIYSTRRKNGSVLGYIVMENIVGETLPVNWPSLEDKAKADIAEQLRGYVSQLQSIPSPDYYGVLGRRPFKDVSFWPEAYAASSGPFVTEQQMVDSIVFVYQQSNPASRKHEYYRRVLSSVLHGHAPTFTHSDLQRKNVLVTNNGTAVLIDWEAAGWYPSFWEYFIALYACHWDDDWHTYLHTILDEYQVEYALMSMVLREFLS